MKKKRFNPNTINLISVRPRDADDCNRKKKLNSQINFRLKVYNVNIIEIRKFFPLTKEVLSSDFSSY